MNNVNNTHRFLNSEVDRPKKLVILLNPIGGSQKAKSVYKNMAGPLFTLAGIHCEVLSKLMYYVNDLWIVVKECM